MKKVLLSIISLIMCTLMISSVSVAFADDDIVLLDECKKGDVNCDEKITMDDIVMLQRHLAKLLTISGSVENEGDALWAADVTFDNNVNMEDVVMIQKYIAKLISSFENPNGGDIFDLVDTDTDEEGWSQVVKP